MTISLVIAGILIGLALSAIIAVCSYKISARRCQHVWETDEVKEVSMAEHDGYYGFDTVNYNVYHNRCTKCGELTFVYLRT